MKANKMKEIAKKRWDGLNKAEQLVERQETRSFYFLMYVTSIRQNIARETIEYRRKIKDINETISELQRIVK